MKKFLFVALATIITESISAQDIMGRVIDHKNEPLIGATVFLPIAEKGSITDINGQFEIKNVTKDQTAIVSFVGFKTDTISLLFGQHLTIKMQEDTELDEVVIKSSTTFIDNVEPIHAEVITEKELLKTACCNLSESFETNASVDVSFTDAVTGTKTIRMLGLDGKYTLINRENMPHVRGLSARLGLNYIPGTWIQSIDVGKGSGSVINGYESMTGQINVEFKKPENSEKLYLNAYGNSFGRMELNANTAFAINDKWSGALLTHADYFNNEIDGNNDGFMDLPKAKQVNILNRYKYRGDRIVSQIGFHFLKDQKAGGQNGFNFGDDALTSTLYGYSSDVSKMEVFGKVGVLFPHAPYKGWGFIYSASVQDNKSGFGHKAYTGQEKTLYTNLIHQNIIGNTFHQYKTGLSFMIDDFTESFADSAFSRTEIVPGAFFEYSYMPNDKFTLVSGLRTDAHNLYGLYVTPRLHMRYEVMPEGTLRLAIGKGYRTSNIITENSQAFISSRNLVVEEELKPEESWNMGGSFVKEIKIGEQNMSIIADYFHTEFQNQVIVDMDQNPSEVRFYNLDGRSFANSYQIEVGTSLNDFISTKAAYKYYDVKATIDGDLRPLPYVSKNRTFWNVSYTSKYDIWQADATLQWYGSKRLPNTTSKSAEFQRPDYSPDFTNVNVQLSRTFRWGNVYIGSENLLDFKQKNPIIDPENPFSDQFDGSLVWGPIAGRMVYFGMRYKIN
ncbi:MAG: carboxypeptidase-like regulatory domain-containing protein [Cyclobacteriaceae bacterium]